jgi:uncharacterized protein YgiM (DUF1202 family)
MKKYILSTLLLLLTLACSLTTVPDNNETPTARPTTYAPAKIQTEKTATPSQVPPTPIPTPSTCLVTAQTLHLRSCAGLECAVKGWLTEGIQLTVQAANNGWYQVKTPAGENGWINSKFCGGQP